MDSIASVGSGQDQLQQNVQVTMIKKSQDIQMQLAARLLDSVAASAPPVISPSPAGVGQNVDRWA